MHDIPINHIRFNVLIDKNTIKIMKSDLMFF